MLDLAMWEDVTADPSVLIVDGSIVRLYVRDGCLTVKDGPRDNERIRTIPRAPRVVRHVIILSAHGTPTLEAQRWMTDQDITWMVVDTSGKSPRTLSRSDVAVDAKLMRMQAMCAEGYPLEGIGVEIWRGFVTHKLEGQAWVAEHMLSNPVVAKAIRARNDMVQISDSVKAITGYEGNAADAYWSAWKGLAPQWYRPFPIKPHWLAYPGRKSLRRSETNRRATDPVNCMLNFAYHCAETECIIALQAAGLDPRMGVYHADQPGRASFALDLIEVIRPRVDEIVLKILGDRIDKRLFREDKEGIVQLVAPLTHQLASDVRGISHLLAPDVARVKSLLTAG